MAAENRASEDFTPGVVVALGPRLRRITAPNAGFMTGPGTNTYLVGELRCAIVDPGPDDPGHLDAIARAAGSRAERILVTHNHPDHSAGAASLAARLQVPVYAHATRLTGVRHEGFAPDGFLADGERVQGADYSLTCLHTPGHAADHLCFLHHESGILLAGDHVMDSVTVVIAQPDGDMAAYLDSLERLKHTPITAIAPAHGGLMRAPAQVFEDIIAHRRLREEQIVDALAQEPRSVDALVPALYPDLPVPFRPVAGWQVEAHLRKLAAEGRVTAGPASQWRLA